MLSSNSKSTSNSLINEIGIPILNKRDKYVKFHQWSETIEAHLTAHGLWDSKAKSPKVTKESDRSLNQQIKLFIRAHIDEELREATQSIDVGHELFSDLFTRYTAHCERDGRNAKTAFYSLKKGSMNFARLFVEVERLANEMAVCLKDTPTITDKIETVLNSLSKDYMEEARSIRKEIGHFEAMWEVQDRLEEFEEILNARQPIERRNSAFKTVERPTNRPQEPTPTTKPALHCDIHPFAKNHLTKDCKAKPFHSAQLAALGYQEAEPVNNESLISNSCFVGHDATKSGSIDNPHPQKWLMDSGATAHFTFNKEDFFNYTPCKTDAISIATPNGDRFNVLGTGKVKILASVGGKCRPLILENVYHVPQFKFRLLSEVAINDTGLHIWRGNGTATIWRYDNTSNSIELIATGSQSNGDGSLFVIYNDAETPQKHELAFAISKPTGAAPTHTLKQAHRIFGHISPDKIINMAKSGRLLFKLSDKKWETCPLCMETSMTSPNQPQAASRIAQSVGEFVNADVVGPLLEVNEEAKYVSCLIDRYSSYASVETMATKDASTIVKHLQAFQQELHTPIKTLRSDNGKEYVNNTLGTYLKDKNICHETTTPHSPAQNGKVERFNRTIIDMTKKFLAELDDRDELWPYAIDHATYVYNRISHSANPDEKSPYEMIHGYPADISHLKPFGTTCWINTKSTKKKLDKKGTKGTYIGHPKNSDGFLVLTDDEKVHTSRYVRFASQFSDFTKKGTQEYIIAPALLATSIDLNKADFDDPKWRTAVSDELQSHLNMNTFTLVDPKDIPKHVKPLTAKMVYKAKIGRDKEISRFKARMVIRGCSQKYGQDFEDTYAPVTDVTEILTMLTLAAKDDLEVHQIDIKTAYLNAPLQHDIYVRLPSDLPFSEFSGRTAKLNKAIYGLKQAGFEWYNHLRNTLETFSWTTSDLFPCVYKRRINGDLYFITSYVDDLLIIGKDKDVISAIKEELKQQYDIEDSNEINFLLGMRITRDRGNRKFYLDQEAYIDRLIEKFEISSTSNTPCSDDLLSLQPKNIKPIDPELFRRKLGSLLHISRYTRPEISYAVNYLSRRANSPSHQDHKHMDIIFAYLKRTKHVSFAIIGPTPDQWEIRAISDADYAADRESSQSTTGIAIFIGPSLVSWGSKRQNCVSESTTESEYIALSKCAKKSTVLSFLADFLEQPLKVALWCDNNSTIASIKRGDIPPKLKHIRVKYHSIKAKVLTQGYTLRYIESANNIADIFTKPLTRSLFESLRRHLNLVFPPYPKIRNSSGSIASREYPDLGI